MDDHTNSCTSEIPLQLTGEMQCDEPNEKLGSAPERDNTGNASALAPIHNLYASAVRQCLTILYPG